MGLVVGGSAIAIGALAAAVFIELGTRGAKRGKHRELTSARGLRRGAMVGSATGLLTLLRVVDGLTPLTAVFVIAPFVVAEAVLSIRRP
ncbi:MAG: hypothetical protein ABI888_02225 [Chloroflexota bacterium]